AGRDAAPRVAACMVGTTLFARRRRHVAAIAVLADAAADALVGLCGAQVGAAAIGDTGRNQLILLRRAARAAVVRRLAVVGDALGDRRLRVVRAALLVTAVGDAALELRLAIGLAGVLTARLRLLAAYRQAMAL